MRMSITAMAGAAVLALANIQPAAAADCGRVTIADMNWGLG